MNKLSDTHFMLWQRIFAFCKSHRFCVDCPLLLSDCHEAVYGNASIDNMLELCKRAGIELPTEIESESEPMTNDIIAHPSHYTDGRKFEPKDVIRDWGLNFNLGSAVKYISRAGRKDDILQDLKKARQFLDFEIEAIEKERKEAKNETD